MEENQQFRIAEIEVARSVADENIVGIFRFENSNRNKKTPALLMLAEIHSSLYAYERLLDRLNGAAEQARHLVSQVDQDPLARFEKLVQKLNEAAAAFVAEEPVPIQWSRVNIYVMELSDGHLCFTGVGKLMNIFLQKQEDGDFRAFDLFGSLDQTAVADPQKPFSTIICGDIKIGDVLLTGTNNFERVRNELKLKERLISLPPVTAAMEIRQDLERRGIPDDFVAVIIASCEIKPAMQEPLPMPERAEEAAPQPSTASIEKLLNTEDETSQHLAPQIAPVPNVGLKPLAQKILSVAQDRVQRLYVLLREKFKRSRIQDPMALASLRGMNAGYQSALNKKKKMIILGVGAAFICLVIGLVWWNFAKKAAAESAAWTSAYDQAADNKNRAESDLVYGNESRARTELGEAEKIIATLTTKNRDRASQLDKLNKDVSDLKERLRKLVKIDNPTELATLDAAAGENSLSAPVLTKDYAYAVDNATQNILKVDLQTKGVKRIPLPSGTTRIVSGSEGTNSVIFSTENGKLVALNKATDLAKSVAWARSRTSSTTDIVLYAGKLYALDAADKQIWRSLPSGDGFGPETAYIKASDTPLDGAVGLAIDSNVYVLKNDGTLYQFLSGGQVSFALVQIDPPLKSSSGLWTSKDGTDLIVADAAGKRLVIFDKSGALKAQIISTQFRSPRSLSADDVAKRAIIVDGNRLLMLTLP